MKLCFIATAGGHLNQLLMLRPLMKKYDSYIVTEETSFSSSSDESKHRTYYVSQINRKQVVFPIKLIYLLYQSIRILAKEKPDIIISTGALASVPTCIIAKLFGKKVIFIESFAKINSPTLSGRLVYYFADLFIIQWDSLQKFYPNAVIGGWIY